MGSTIREEDLVLFQGDSITDAGRNRENDGMPGAGYVMMAAAWYSALHPARRLRFLNRGISGNRTRDLVARWQTDCIDLRPSVVSILIGVNDTWRRYDSNDATPVERFEAEYREILTVTKDRLNVPVILCEPFVLPVPEDRKRWREDLDPKIDVVRNLAREFGALLVPFDGLFARASTMREPAFWSPDGVHPSAAGHALMAQAWIETFASLKRP